MSSRDGRFNIACNVVQRALHFPVHPRKKIKTSRTTEEKNNKFKMSR